MLLICFVSGSATCARRGTQVSLPPPPTVWTETPSLAELATVINRSGNIQQLSTNSATVDVLTMPAVPKLNATLNLERERRFRLRANLPVMLGAGLDLGSNDELFWFEVPEGVSKTLYYARHDQYQQQLSRAILPVDPTWVIDALGLARIDPGAVVAGPVKRADGKLEIRTAMTMPSGIYQRVYYIDPTAGHVTDQYVFGPSGVEIARAHTANHVYYDQARCALPHQVELHLTPALGPPLAMRIEIGSYAINQLLSGDPQLFTMPTSAANAVDLTTLTRNGPAFGTVPAAASPAQYRADASAAYPLRGAY